MNIVKPLFIRGGLALLGVAAAPWLEAQYAAAYGLFGHCNQFHVWHCHHHENFS